MGGVYFNEFDPFAAAWLRQLIAMGQLPAGDVDDRSIADVRPDDLRGYVQCHFFAGIGGWALAARLAGFDERRNLWTGSCPCQPFSVAGKGAGTDDPRHLWPHFFRLIRACRPALVMGEQVAGKAGYGWLDGVLSDLAGEGYAGRGVDIPACAVDAPHIRQRLYWIAVGQPERRGLDGERVHAVAGKGVPLPAGPDGPGEAGGRGGLAASDAWEPEALGLAPGRREHRGSEGGHGSDLAHARSGGPGRWPQQPGGHDGHGDAAGREEGAGRTAGGDENDLAHAYGRGRRCDYARGHAATGDARQADGGRNGTFWTDADWILCHDGKARRTQSQPSVLVDGVPHALVDCGGSDPEAVPISLLAHGVPKRVQKWRGFGNAIVPQLAAEVIGAFLDAEQDEFVARLARAEP